MPWELGRIIVYDYSVTFPYGWQTNTHTHTHICRAAWSLDGRFAIENPHCRREITPFQSNGIISPPVFLSAQGGCFPWGGAVSWYGGRYHRSLLDGCYIKWECFVLSIWNSLSNPLPPFFFFDITRIINLPLPLIPIPHAPPLHVPCVFGLYGWGVTFAWAPCGDHLG